MHNNDKPLPKPPAPRHPSFIAPYEAVPGNDAKPDEAPPQYTEEHATTEQILNDIAGATGMIRIEPFLVPRLTKKT